MCKRLGTYYIILRKEPGNVQKVGYILQNFEKGTRKCAKGWVNTTKF